MYVVKCTTEESYNAVISGLKEAMARYSALPADLTVIVSETNSAARQFVEGLQHADVPSIKVISA